MEKVYIIECWYRDYKHDYSDNQVIRKFFDTVKDAYAEIDREMAAIEADCAGEVVSVCGDNKISIGDDIVYRYRVLELVKG